MFDEVMLVQREEEFQAQRRRNLPRFLMVSVERMLQYWLFFSYERFRFGLFNY